jgi:hypothetical protein
MTKCIINPGEVVDTKKDWDLNRSIISYLSNLGFSNPRNFVGNSSDMPGLTIDNSIEYHTDIDNHIIISFEEFQERLRISKLETNNIFIV